MGTTATGGKYIDLAAMLTLAVCAAALPIRGHAGGNAQVSPSAAQARSAGSAAPAQEAGSEESGALAFSTKHAHFNPAQWGELPGWREDDMRDAWRAFRKSCSVLKKKSAWEEVCARAGSVDSETNGPIRAFFEREFTLYQVSDTDRSLAGVITGYYEPLLRGSRTFGHPYIYPVYATPDDMLRLDIRALPDKGSAPVPARVEGRKVIPVFDVAGGTQEGRYILDITGVQADIRDKTVRLRVDGTRVVPYFTRAEIERGGLSGVRVLLWVDDPAALYSMQIQGSGKVRLANGGIVRLAYAEQNGHPFQPTLATGSGVKTRSILSREAGAETVEDSMRSAEDAGEGDGQVILTRGLKLRAASVPAPVASTQPKGQDLAPEVEAIVQALLEGRPTAAGGKPRNPELAKADSGSGRSKPSALPGTQASGDSALYVTKADGGRPPRTPSTVNAQPKAVWPAEISADPSYVFFREIPDSDEGPIGALGVALTAGRSLAVDPRTTPLGFPVFVSTTLPGRVGNLNRLMLAQDTGGAIRGAVRGDYFWGFGTDAGARASRMKESGRMWLLLPKNQPIAARERATRVRSIGGPTGGDTDCVVADPELCVED